MGNCEKEACQSPEKYLSGEIKSVSIDKAHNEVVVCLENNKVITIESKLDVWGKGIASVINIKRGYTIINPPSEEKKESQ